MSADSIFNTAWQDLLNSSQHAKAANQNPKGYVLGGQPGSGKGSLSKRIERDLHRNVLVINGDEFRRYHPEFSALQEKHGPNAVEHTAQFSGQLTEKAIQKAIDDKYNLVVEGTFRTASTPIKTLEQLKASGYETAVYVMTTDKQTSWQSTLERYQRMESEGLHPRATPKHHHDLVVDVLGRNADTVLASKLADHFRVFSREGLLFDKQLNPTGLPSHVIDLELHKNDAYEIFKTTGQDRIEAIKMITDGMVLEKKELLKQKEFQNISIGDSYELDKIAFQRSLLRHNESFLHENQLNEKLKRFDVLMMDPENRIGLPDPRLKLEVTREEELREVEKQYGEIEKDDQLDSL